MDVRPEKTLRSWGWRAEGTEPKRRSSCISGSSSDFFRSPFFALRLGFVEGWRDWFWTSTRVF